VVLRDAGDSPYNSALLNAVKAHWKFTSSTDFGTVTDLATTPLDPTKTYLAKVRKAMRKSTMPPSWCSSKAGR
jgi:hypothetical protein